MTQAQSNATHVNPGPIYVVEDKEALRQEMVEALHAHGLAAREFADPAAFLNQFATLETGCVVAAPCPRGWQVLSPKLVRHDCRVALVAVVAAFDVPAAVEAMKAGAADVVTYPFDRAALAATVRAAIAAREAAAADPAATALRLRLARLTRRERQVLDAIVRGEANKGIAAGFGISPRTVEVHRAKVMEKLACRNLADLVRLAIQAGLAAQ